MEAAVKGVVVEETGVEVDVVVVLIEEEVEEVVSEGRGNKVGIVHFLDSAVNVC